MAYLFENNPSPRDPEITGTAECEGVVRLAFNLHEGDRRARLVLGRKCAREMFAHGLTGNNREPNGTAICAAECLEAPFFEPLPPLPEIS